MRSCIACTEGLLPARAKNTATNAGAERSRVPVRIPLPGVRDRGWADVRTAAAEVGVAEQSRQGLRARVLGRTRAQPAARTRRLHAVRHVQRNGWDAVRPGVPRVGAGGVRDGRLRVAGRRAERRSPAELDDA